jgi:REP element-mobilizing transposase RayT
MLDIFRCDRYWLLTWTTYGTWLPGDSRGFVSNIRIGFGPETRLNIPGTPTAPSMPELREHVQAALDAPPIFLTQQNADVLFRQFQETADYRGWLLIGAAIMTSHVHIVVGVLGDPDPETILRDFKAYGSRALNRKWGKPKSDTWWTESGSKRKLKTDDAVLRGTRYVRDQESPLVVWIRPEFLPELGSGDS